MPAPLRTPFVIVLSGRGAASASAAWRSVLDACLTVDANVRASAVVAPLSAATPADRAPACEAIAPLIRERLVHEAGGDAVPAPFRLRRWYAARAALLSSAPAAAVTSIPPTPPIVIVIENADQCSPSVLHGLAEGCAPDARESSGIPSNAAAPRFLLVLGSSAPRDSLFLHSIPRGALHGLQVSNVYLLGALQLVSRLCDRLLIYGALPLRLRRQAFEFLRDHAAEYTNGAVWFIHALRFIVTQHWAEAEPLIRGGPEAPAADTGRGGVAAAAAAAASAPAASPAWLAYLVADVERWAVALADGAGGRASRTAAAAVDEAGGPRGHSAVAAAAAGSSFKDSRLWRLVCRVAAWMPEGDVESLLLLAPAAAPRPAHPPLDEGSPGCADGVGHRKAGVALAPANDAPSAAALATGPLGAPPASKSPGKSTAAAPAAGVESPRTAAEEVSAAKKAKRRKILEELALWSGWKPPRRDISTSDASASPAAALEASAAAPAPAAGAVAGAVAAPAASAVDLTADAAPAPAAPDETVAKAHAKRARVLSSLVPWSAWKTLRREEDEEIAARAAALAPPALGDSSMRLLGVSLSHLPLAPEGAAAGTLSQSRLKVAARLYDLTVHRLGWLTAAAVLMRSLGRDVFATAESHLAAAAASSSSSTHRSLSKAVRNLHAETIGARATSLPVMEEARTAVGRMGRTRLREFLVASVTLLETGVGPAHCSSGQDAAAGGACGSAFPPWAAAVHPAHVFARHLNDARRLLRECLSGDAGAAEPPAPSAAGEPPDAISPLPVLSGPAARRQLKEGLHLKATQQRLPQESARAPSALVSDRAAVAQWLDELVDCWLVPVTALPMHGAVELARRVTPRLKAVLHAAPRPRALDALAHPRAYLACECCPERAGDVSAAMPDAALCWAILSAETSEARRTAPLAVLFSTFADVARNGADAGGGGGSSPTKRRRNDSEQQLRADVGAEDSLQSPVKLRVGPAAHAALLGAIRAAPDVLRSSGSPAAAAAGHGSPLQRNRLGPATGVYAAATRRGPASLPEEVAGGGAAASGGRHAGQKRSAAAAAAAPERGDASSDSDNDDADAGDSASGGGSGSGSRPSDPQLRVRFTYALAELQALGLARVSRRRGGGAGDAIERCVFQASW